MSRYFKISFVGSGNVASHLSKALEDYGHTIVEVYSRDPRNAEKLCSKLYETAIKVDLDFSDTLADIIIIAVSDKAIASVLNQIKTRRHCIIAHTSGTVSLDVFENLPNPTGVFYPIQTFSQDRTIDFRQVPFSIESINRENQNILKSLASSLSKKIYFNTTEERRIIHLAAVFASNFTNHMYTISKGLLESNDLSFDIVKPLIEEVTKKALTINPENAQTGPAIRNDFNTIEKHISYLSQEEGLTAVYKAITDDIIKTYED